MVSLLWRIRLQERQERVGLGRIGSSMTSLDGSDGRRGNWFGGIVFCKLRSEVCRKGGSLG